MALKISDHFWGDTGFPVVEERTNQIRDCYANWISFFKERAAIEEAYAKQLYNLMKGMTGLVEFGTTREAWLNIYNETGTIIKNSRQFAEKINTTCLNPLQQFKETQSKQRKPFLAEATKLTKENEKLKINYVRTNEKYVKYSTEAEKTGKNLESAKLNGKNPNELVKLTSKLQKLSKEAMLLEHESQEEAQKLSSFQNILSEKMTGIYDGIQQLESERIQFLKDLLIKFAEGIIPSKEFESNLYQRFKEKFKSIDPTQDINEFISQKQTGTDKPSASDITFTPIRSASISTLGDSYNNYKEQEDNSEFQGISSNPNLQSGGAVEINYIGECRACYDYIGSDQFELDFSIGDVMQLIEKDDGVGWWTGELRGRLGLIPSNYVEEIET